MYRFRRHHRAGFTLVELMIVLMILLLVISILIPNMMRAKYRAQLTACESNIKTLATAIEMYSTENKSLYPLAPLTGAWTQANMGLPIVQCPTGPGIYGYLVDNNTHTFTLACDNGCHSIGLPGVVALGYPQFSHVAGMVEK